MRGIHNEVHFVAGDFENQISERLITIVEK